MLRLLGMPYRCVRGRFSYLLAGSLDGESDSYAMYCGAPRGNA